MLSNPKVDAALERALELGEVGVQVAAYLDGDLAIDAWIGVANESTGEPVHASTLFPVFSCTKGILATVVHLHAERGLLDPEAPVATYWPEYAVNGKEGVTIRQVLQHRAGVPHMPADLTPAGLHDWDALVHFMETVTPVAPPGEETIYHPLSMGYILGEVLRRTDPAHRMFGQLVREELCDPLRIADLFVGLPPEEEPRVARLTFGPNPPDQPEMPWTEMRRLSMPAEVAPAPDSWNLPVLHQADIPAGGAICTARAGARLFAMLANGGELDGVRLLSEERILAQTELRSNPEQVDQMSGQAVALGVGGYFVADSRLPDIAKHRDPAAGTGDQTLISNGAGGSIVWADMETRLSVMITHNRMFPESVPVSEHPFVALGDAIRSSLSIS